MEKHLTAENAEDAEKIEGRERKARWVSLASVYPRWVEKHLTAENAEDAEKIEGKERKARWVSLASVYPLRLLCLHGR